MIVICTSSLVGKLPSNHDVYKILTVGILPLNNYSPLPENELQLCPLHNPNKPEHENAALSKTWGTIKSATTTLKTATEQAAASVSAQVINKQHYVSTCKLDLLNESPTGTISWVFMLKVVLMDLFKSTKLSTPLLKLAVGPFLGTDT